MERRAGSWGAWLLLCPLLFAAESAWGREPAVTAGSIPAPRVDAPSASPAESRTSPRELLREAMVRLRQLPDSNRRVKRSVRDIVEAVAQSLSHKGESLYLDGWQIRSYPDGKRVFKYNKRALRRLQRGIRSVRGNREVQSVFEQVAETLLEAQTEIARVSIEAAQRLSAIGLADDWQVERAIRELKKAGRHEDPRKAMDALKKAWEVSQRAVRRQNLAVIQFRDSPDPFSPELATSTLSITFKILARGHYSLDYVRVIQDPSSGEAIRILNNRPWDGRDGIGRVVPDGHYPYLAFGQLTRLTVYDRRRGRVPVRKPGEYRAASFPITGTVMVDATPPVLQAETTPPPNHHGWHNSDVTVSFKAEDNLAGLASVSPNLQVTTEGPARRLRGMAVDRAGNSTSLDLEVRLDKQPPSIEVTWPTTGSRLEEGGLRLTGLVRDSVSGVAQLTCNGTLVTSWDTEFSCDLRLREGENRIRVEAVDHAGNGAAASIRVHGLSAAAAAGQFRGGEQ